MGTGLGPFIGHIVELNLKVAFGTGPLATFISSNKL